MNATRQMLVATRVSRNRLHRIFVVLAMTLVACKDGGSGPSGTTLVAKGATRCLAIDGGIARGTSQCAGCTISSPEKASDTDLNSYADAMPLASSQSVTVTMRAIVQSGTVFSAGSQPGAFVTQISGLVSGGQSTTINTYLNGQLQDSSAVSINESQPRGGTGAESYYSITATKPFDAVEVVGTANLGNNIPGNSADYKIYEICGDGGA